MIRRTSKSKLISRACLFVAAALLNVGPPPTARAANVFLDQNSSLGGAGATGPVTWDLTTLQWVDAGTGTTITGTTAATAFTFTNSDVAFFLGGTAQTITLGQATTLNGINDATGMTFTGSTFTLAGTAPTITTGATTTMNSVLAGSAGLTKAGTGTLILNGVNTYSGTTTLGAGTLRLGSTVALGTSTLSLNGGTLDAASALTINNAITFANGLTFTGTANLTQTTGAITLGATRTITVNNNTLSLGGVISGATFGITKAGAGTLTLTAANTYTGSVAVNAGTLQIGQSSAGAVGAITSGALGTGSLTLNGGTLSAGGTTPRNVFNTFTVAADVTLGDATNTGKLTLSAAGNLGTAVRTLTVSSAIDFTGIISGIGGGITKAGTDTLNLAGANTFTGGVTINAGNIKLGSDNVGSVGSITSGPLGTGTLALSGGAMNSDSATARSVLNPFTISAATTLGNATNPGKLTFSAAGNLGAAVRTLTISSDVQFDGILSGTGGGISKAGTGVLTLTGVNTYTGGTSLTAGTLILGNTAALGTGLLTPSGGTLDAAFALTITNAITFAGDLTFTGTANLTQTTGVISLGATRIITVNGTNTLSLGGVISGASGLTKAGTGRLILANVANTYTGITSMGSGGPLQIAGDLSLGAVPAVTATALTFTTGGRLNTTADFTLAANRGTTLTGNGGFTVNSGTTLTYAGIITGAGQLQKEGPGTLVLSGANTYVGGAILTLGTLILGSTGALGTSTLTPNGGTLDAASALTITNAITFANDLTFTGTANLTQTTGVISLVATRIITVNNNTLSLGGVISGATFGISKAGAGTLTLSGANTFTGNVTLSAGTLNLNNAAATGTTAGTFAINGGTLDNTTGAAITTAAKPLALNGNFTFTGTQSLDLGAGATTLSADRIITVTANTLTLGGAISGSTFVLTKAGAGTLTLNGIVSGSKTLATTALSVTAGKVVLGNNANTFTGDITVAGSTAILEVTTGAIYTTASPFGTVAGGTSTKQLFLTAGGTFRLASGTLNNNAVTSTNLGGGIIFNFGTGGGVLDVASGATLTIDEGTTTGTALTANQIQGAGSITKIGTGILSIDDSTVYAGQIIVNAGLLQPASANAFGTTTANTVINSGAALNVNGITMTNAEPLNITGTGLASSPQGALTNTLATGAAWVGPITLGGNATIGASSAGGFTLSSGATVNVGTNTLTLLNAGSGNFNASSIISGGGNVIVTGTGQYVPNAQSTYSGGTTLSANTSTIPQVNSTGSAGSVTSGPFGTGSITAVATAQIRASVNQDIVINNNLTLNGGITFLTAATENNFTFGGPVTLSGGNAIITSTVGNTVAGKTAIISGVIDDAGNSVTLTKAGTGNLTLSGANTYTGGTTVNAGLLNVTGSLAATGNITVAATGALSLISNSANAINSSGFLTLGTAAGTAIIGLDLGTSSDSLTGFLGAITAGKVYFNLSPTTGFGAGTYTLLGVGGLGGLSGATYGLGSLPGGYSYSLSATDSDVTLTVTAGAPAATNLYWGGANSSWATNANWFSDAAGITPAGTAPSNSSTVYFSTSTATGPTITTTLDAPFTIDNLIFNGNPTGVSAVTISAGNNVNNSLTLSPVSAATGLTVGANNGTISIAVPFVLGAPQTWTVDGTVGSATSALVVSGAISGVAANTIAFNSANSNPAQITLSSPGNSYSGASSVGANMTVIGGATGAISPNTQWTINGTLGTGAFNQSTGSLVGGSGILQNGSATNATLTIGSDNLANATFAGTLQDGSTGTFALTKTGTGTQTLSGTSTYTGNTTVNGGTLNITGSLAGLATTTNLAFGGAAGNTIVNISGSVSNYKNFTGANVAGSIAVMNQTAGTASTLGTSGSDTQWVAQNGGYGYLNITGGTFYTGRFDAVGVTGGGTAVVYVGGSGLFNNNLDWLILPRKSGVGQLTVGPGGSLVRTAAVTANLGITMDSSDAHGALNIAGGTVDTGLKSIQFGFGTAAFTNTRGFVNLAGGTLSVGAAINQSNTAGQYFDYFNFVGGTLKANAAITWLPATSATGHTLTATIYGAVTNNNNANTAFNALIGTNSNFSGGLVVDTNNFATNIGRALRGADGVGVTQADIGDISVRSGNSAYIGAPSVVFSAPASGTGVPASGYAVIDNITGKVSGIVITNPGIYAANETPTITLTGGGGSITAFNTAALSTANTSGGLTKTGLGTLTLGSTGSTYTGGVSINAGTLALGAGDVIPTANSVNVNGGTLDMATFTNTVAGVILQGGGTITGTTGVLTSTSDYDLRSGSVSGGLGGITGATKTTSGTVTLAGANTFTGPINVNGGILAFATSPATGGALGSSTVVNLGGGVISYTGSISNALNRPIVIGASNGTVNVTNSLGNLTIASITSTAGNLIKTGPGTATLTGTTTLNGGLAGVTVSEGKLVAGFGLGGVSTITIDAAGNLSLNNAAIQALTLGNTTGALTLVSGARLGFELNSSTNDSIAVGATGTAVTAGTVSLDFFGTVAVGTYNLLSAPSGLTTGGTAYVLGSAPAGFNYVFTSTDTLVSVQTTVLSNVYWTNSQISGSWNTVNAGPLSNFSSLLDGTTNYTLLPQAADTVVFSSSALSVGASPINTTLDAAFTLDSLRFTAQPADATLSIAPGTGGSLTLSPFSTSNGITVDANGGAVTISAPLTAASAQTWSVNGTGTSSLTLSGNLTFTGNVTKEGAGVLTLSGTNTGAGNFTLTSGLVNTNANGALGTGTLTLGLGTTLENSSAGLVTLAGSANLFNGSFTYTGATQSLSLGTGAATLGGNIQFTVSGNTLTVGGAIGETGGARGLTKTGNGTLVLNGNSTYSGRTTLSAGSLTLAGDNSTAAGGVTLNGGTLNLNNAGALGSGTFIISAGSIDSTIAGVTLNAVNATLAGSFTFTGTSNLNLGTGAITLTVAPTITTTAGNLTLGGNISGPFGLTKAGAGTLITAGTLSFTGALTVSGGTAVLNGSNSFTGGLTVSGGTAQLNGSNSFTGGLTVSGGTALLNGSNSYAGAISVSAGSLKIGNATALAATVAPAMSGTGTFDLNGFSQTVAGTMTGVAGNTFTNSSSLTVASTATTPGTPSGTGIYVDALNVTGAQTAAIAALITDGPTRKTQIIVNNGNASFATGNTANTFSGGLVLAHSATGTRLMTGTITGTPWGTGPIIIGQTATDKAGIFFATATQTLTNPIVFNTALGTDRVGIRTDVAGITLAGTITANLAPATFTSQTAVGAFTLTGQVTGAQGLVLDITSLGTAATAFNVTLNNNTVNPNNYQGNTVINLNAASGKSATLKLGAANQIPNGTGTGNLVINSNGTGLGTLNLASFSDTINGLSGNGTVDGTSGTPTLTIGDNNQSSTFSGILKNTAGTLSVTKIGTGTLTLSGASTHTGVTTVNDGTLQVSGGSALADTGVVSLGNVSGATFTVVGSETIAALTGGGSTGGAVSIAAAQTLTLSVGGGNSYAGTVSGAGALTLSGGNQTLSGAISLSGSATSINVTAGLLTLSNAANNYTGITAIGTGTSRGVIVTADNALGATGTGNETTIAGTTGVTGSYLQFLNGVNYTAAEKITGLGDGDSRGFIQAAGTGTTSTFAGDIGVTGNSRIGTQDGASLTLTGKITQTTGAILFRTGSTTGDFVTLSNANNTFTGDTTVYNLAPSYAGVRLGITNGLPTNRSISGFGGTGVGTALDLNGKNQTLNGLVAGGGGALKIVNLDTVNPSTLTLNLTTANQSSTATTILGGGSLGVISLVKDGTFTQTLSGTNTFTGGTTINGGILTLGHATNTLADTGVVNVNGGTLALGTNTDTVGTVTLTSGSITASGAGTLIGSSYDVRSGNVSAILAGAGTALTKTTSGTVTLTGTNTYTGTTLISAGTLEVSGGSAITNTGLVSLADEATAVFKLNASETIGNLSGGGSTGGNVNLQGNTLTLGDSTNQTFTGIISGTAGSITKTGAGILILSGANTFTGNTTISGGQLALANALALQNSAYDTTGSTGAIGLDATGFTTPTLGGLSGAVNLATAITGYGAITNLTLNPQTGNTVTYSGIIADGISLTKTGAGTQTLSGTNTFTGGTTINGGILTLGHATDTLADTGVVNVNGGTLALGTNTDTVGTVTLTSGSITGSGAGALTGSSYDVRSGNVSAILAGVGIALTKTTSGTVTLTGTNTYTGTTLISAGTLTLSGTGILSGTSGITINGLGAKYLQTSSVAGTAPITLTQGTLTGSGTVGAVDVANTANAIISNNNGVAGLSLTIGSLTFNGAASINLFSDGVSTSIMLASGALVTSAAGIVTINPSAAIWTNGTFNLVSYTGGVIGGAGFGQFNLGTVTGLTSRQTTILADTGSALTLAISGFNTVWAGATGTPEWSTNTLANPKNWKLSDGGATVTDFVAGDFVVFDDTATLKTVDISHGDVAPTTLSFTNTSGNNYTLTGTSGITGNTGLSKTGSGTLTISTANTYTGTTLLGAGVLRATTSASALGAGNLTLAGGELQLANDAGLVFGRNTTVTGNVQITSDTLAAGAGVAQTLGSLTIGGQTLTIAKGGNATGATAAVVFGVTTLTNAPIFSLGTGSTLSLGAVTNGAATATLTGAGNFVQTGVWGNGSGSLTLDSGFSGTATLSQLNTFTGNVTIGGGTLAVEFAGNGTNSALGSVSNSRTISINTGGTLSANVAGGIFNNNFSAAATSLPGLNIVGGTLTNAGTATNSALGNIFLVGGTLAATTGSATGYGSWNLNGSVTSTGTSTISSTASVPTTLSAATGTTTTFDVQDGTLTASAALGQITASGDARTSSLTKAGAGIMILSGINTYTGATNISAGTLSVAGAGSLGSGTYAGAIANAGTLIYDSSATQTLSGAITGVGVLTKSGSGTLTLSSATTAYSGATSLTNGTLVLSSTTAFASAVTVAAGATLQYSPTATNAQLAAGAISLIGTMTYAPAGGSYQVVSSSTSNQAVTVSGGSSIINISPGGSFAAGTGGLYLDGGLQGGSALTVNATVNGFGLIIRRTNSTFSGTMTVTGNASITPGTGSGMVIGAVGTALSNASITNNGTLELGDSAAGMGWAVSAVTGTTVAIDALTGSGVVVGNMAASSTRTLSVGNGGGSGTFSGIIANGINNTLSITKAGAGTQTFSNLSSTAASNYSGATIIDNGTLTLSTTSPTLTGVLTFGAAAASTNVATLDLSGVDSSATFTGVALVRTNSSSANVIALGTKTLTLNGGLTMGYNAAGGTGATSSNLTITGAGTMAINGATINISVNQTAAANLNYWSTATLDATALASFSTNVTTFNIGVGSTTQGPGTVLLSDTANSILATTMVIGNTGSNNGKGPGTLTLGTGTNSIQADTIQIGRGKSSGPGLVKFASQTAGSPGTVIITNKAGSGGAAIDIANVNGTGTGGGATGTLDLRGHVATVNASTLSIATTDAAINVSGTTGTVSFDAGTFSVATLNMGLKTGASTGTATGILNIGGGAFTVNTAFTLGSQATGGASSATVNLTGGTLTSNVNILNGGGSVTSVLNLSGGTLDMTGKNLGSATAVTLNAISGSLQNLAQLNNGGTLTKTGTAVTDNATTVTIEGTNSYTGNVAITVGGIVAKTSSALGTGTKTIDINNGSVGNSHLQLDGSGGDISLSADFTYRTSNGTNNGTIINLAGNNTLAGQINMVSGGGATQINVLGGTLNVTANLTAIETLRLLQLNGVGSNTFSGNITHTTGNNFGVTKSNTGTWTLTGINTYTGTTTVSAGTLEVSGGSAIANTGLVTLADVATAIFQLNAAETIGNLSGGGSTGGNVNLQGNTLTLGDSTNQTFAGIISGTAGSITKTGNGILTLSGANTYIGTTLISAGTLEVSGGSAITNTGLVSLADVATAIFKLNAAETIGNLSGGGSTGGNVNLQGNTLTLGDSTSQTFAGIISGTAGSITKTGNGILILSGANTYTGNTTISGGQLALANALALQNSAYDTTGSTGAIGLDVTGYTTPTLGGLSGAVNLATAITGYGAITNLTLNPQTGNTATYSGVIADGAAGISLTKTGAGTQTLSGANTYTGGNVVNAGILKVNVVGAIGSSAGALAMGGGQLDLNGLSHTVGAVTLTTAATSVDTITNGSLTGTSYAASNTTGTAIISANLLGTAGFAKSGAGTLTLSGANTYTGATSINGGRVVVSSLGSTGASALGASDRAVASNLALNGAVTLEYAGTGETTSRSFTIGGTGLTLASTGTGAINFNASALVAFNADGNGTRQMNLTGTNTGENTFGATLTGTPLDADKIANIIKQGVGTWLLTGAANRFHSTLLIEVNGGTLGLGAGAVGNSGYSGEIAINQSATLRWLAGNTDDLSARLRIADGTVAKIEITAGVVTFANPFLTTGVNNTGTLYKTGNGSLTLAVSQIVHNLTVDAGLLNVGTGATVGAVTVTNGGTLGGKGTTGAVTVNAGGTLSPGASPGILTMESLTLAGGSIVDWQIHDATGTAGVGYDKLMVTNALDLTGASASTKIILKITSLSAVGPDVVGNALNFANPNLPTTAPTSFLFANVGSLNLGSNANINDVFSVDVSQFRYSDGTFSSPSLWSFSYDSGAVTLTAIPEPSAYGLGLGALALAVAALRRRRLSSVR